jgi:hypothetical protein
MIISCECKKYKFVVRAEDIGREGRLVQCGVCDKKWFQEPPTLEEFKILKDNFVGENENEIVKKETKKEKKNINVPIKYEGKRYINFDKILLTFLVLLIFGILISFEFKDLIIIRYPNSATYYLIMSEFIEYITKYYSDIKQVLFQN